MATTLASFVKSKADQANPFAAFYNLNAPEDFVAVTISADSGEWSSSECGGPLLSDIQPQLADRISAKNKLIGTYRKNLPAEAREWNSRGATSGYEGSYKLNRWFESNPPGI